jgi:hypothetical protein
MDRVYRIQDDTKRIAEALRALWPGRLLNDSFVEILEQGINKKFEWDHNQRWAQETRPMLEAFFHAKYFLEMAIKYGKELMEASQMLPSGWASLLYLYNAR